MTIKVKTPTDPLGDAVAEEAIWQGGVGSEWSCDAIVSWQLLSALIDLAEKAPKAARDEFLSSIKTGWE